MSFNLNLYRTVVFNLGLCVAASIPLSSAHAGPKVCGERNKLAGYLKTKYSENPNALGVSTTGSSVMEIYTSEKGTWTVLMTTTAGISCIMAAGHSWEERDKLAFLPKS